MKPKKHIAFWIAFPIGFLLITLLTIFILDLTNGPLVCLILALIFLAGFFAVNVILRNKKIGFRFIPYGALIITLGIIFASAKPVVEYKPASYRTKNPELTEVLSTPYGDIQGLYTEKKDVEIYARIPFAKAPIGDLRWKEPQDPESWSGVRDCTYFAAKAMQGKANHIVNTLQDLYLQKGWYPDFNSYPDDPMSEDCLYLNVWKPSGEVSNLPVLVYIHGGSLMSGSSYYENYNGEEMARKNVIMVTIAYRLGIFGYFAHPDLKTESPNGTTGNYGLLDQIKALEWVKNNISYFGGDKDNITIAGESAGSSSVSALCATPLASGLFKNAIGESSSVVIKKAPHTFRDLDEAYEMGNNIMKEMGCNSIEEMRKLSADKLISTTYKNSAMTVDGYALAKTPYEYYEEGQHNETNLLDGCNAREAEAFTIANYLLSFEAQPNMSNYKQRLEIEFGKEHASQIINLWPVNNDGEAYRNFNDIITSWWFTYPHYSWNLEAEKNGVNIYNYYFTKNNRYMDTLHSGEIIYAYGNVKHEPKTYRYSEDDLKLSETMLTYWSNFAKNGNPNGEGVPTWDKWSSTSNKPLELNNDIRHVDDKFASLYPIFKDFIDRGGLKGIYGEE